MIEKKPEESLSFEKVWPFLSDYYINSPNPWKARLLLAGSVLCSLIGIGLGFVLGWWCFPFLYAAFMAKNMAMLMIGIGAGALIAVVIAGINYLGHFLKNTLFVDWRSWLTIKFTTQYVKNETKLNFKDIASLYPEIDNPEQRIQENVENVVESSLNLSIGFIEQFSKLIVYVVLLSLVGGSLSFMVSDATIVIPQFMLLTALLVGISTSFVGYYISKSLQSATNEEIVAKSNFRSDLKKLSTNPEEIAIETGQAYYQKKLESDISEFDSKTIQKLSIGNKIISYNYFVSMFQSIVPFLAAAPLYFKDLITAEMFSSVGYYFSMITSSISWFIKSFDTINMFKTSFNRICELQNILEQATRSTIDINSSENDSLEVKNLTLNRPGSGEILVKGLNITFKPGNHTLIKAPSGCGKSSLFKAIAGTWRDGDGQICLPKDNTKYFLPQKAHLPDDTLRNVLNYPNFDKPYEHEAMKDALKVVGLEALCDELDEKIGFKSEGEKQRIAFARVILRQPKWLFLDEATASLDEENEAKIYGCIKQHLPNTTVISIAHRPTVAKYHTHTMFFEKNVDGKISIKIEQNQQ